MKQSVKQSALVALCSVAAMVGCGGGSPPATPSPVTPTTTVSAASLAGAWTLTLTASTVCSQIPSQYRRRTYAAAITASSSGFEVNLPGTSGSMVSGRLAANSTQITFYVYEFVDSHRWVQVLASGTATPSSTRIAGSMDGSFSFYDMVSGTVPSCNATDHQFSFSR